MSVLHDLIARGEAQAGGAWPRAQVDARAWHEAITLLRQSRLALVALWGEQEQVHAALLDEAGAAAGILSLRCQHGRYPAMGHLHAPAIRLERTLRDLSGLEPDGLADPRPWLDHGRWPVRAPLRGRHSLADEPPASRYEFLPTRGESLHEIPVGPVHAGIIEPGHFRFTANGETVVRLEERLGYVHKGVEALMAGRSADRAAVLAGRVSGDSTVAYALAFARAAEAARRIEVPPRAHWLRALLAELERVANHLGDIGAICNDAAFPMLQAQCALLRERVLRAADSCFGHRLMMDAVVPGGVAIDLTGGAAATLLALLAQIRASFPELVELYDNTASLQDRTVGTGVLSAQLAREFAAGGYVGRASGRGFDARRFPGYPPYDRLLFEVPVLQEGDVDARLRIRVREIEQSLALIEQVVHGLPSGPTRAEGGRHAAGEGAALVEGFRGDVFAWVRFGPGGTIERCHLRDPSCFQWPLLEAAIQGNIVADFPLCNKSFNCSYSGHDL